MPLVPSWRANRSAPWRVRQKTIARPWRATAAAVSWMRERYKALPLGYVGNLDRLARRLCGEVKNRMQRVLAFNRDVH